MSDKIKPQWIIRDVKTRKRSGHDTYPDRQTANNAIRAIVTESAQGDGVPPLLEAVQRLDE